MIRTLIALVECAACTAHAPTPPVIDRFGFAEGVSAVDRGEYGQIRSVVVSRSGAITIQNLLRMRSALQCNDWIDSPGNEERMYRTRVWRDFVIGIPLDPAFAKDDQGLGPFRYCTAGVFFLGQILEDRSGALGYRPPAPETIIPMDQRPTMH